MVWRPSGGGRLHCENEAVREGDWEEIQRGDSARRFSEEIQRGESAIAVGETETIESNHTVVTIQNHSVSISGHATWGLLLANFLPTSTSCQLLPLLALFLSLHESLWVFLTIFP